MATDAQLLRAWRDGDEASGQQLFERTFVRLRRFFVSKTSDVSAVDDLIQRTMLASVQRCHTLTDDSRFAAYLFTVARHELFASIRRARRQADTFDSDVHTVHQLGLSPTAALAKAQQQRDLLAAIRRIPVDLQIALELYYWEGLRTADVGEVLGIPPSTATTRLARARTLLRRELQTLDTSLTQTTAGPGDIAQWVAAIQKKLDAADENDAGDSNQSQAED